MLGFARMDFFQAPEEAKEPVKVNFDDVNSPDQQSAAGAGAARQDHRSKGEEIQVT